MHEDGAVSIANIITPILDWDNKASHPWIGELSVSYPGSARNGMPDDATQNELEDIQIELESQLSKEDGCIYIGRVTGQNIRHIYFACKDFRPPSIEFEAIAQQFGSHKTINSNIYKDKYWRTFENFRLI